jgi:DNA-binding NarL/FixJ family response regulator
MKKFLLIDDHPIAAIGIQFLLHDNFKNVEVHKLTSGKGILSLIKKINFDMIIMDLMLPKTDTQALVSNILVLQAEVRVLMYTSCSEDIYAIPYLQLGAKGFIHKSSSDEEIILAIKTILTGNIFLSKNSFSGNLGPSFKNLENPFYQLSKRELEILNHLLSGKSAKEIAAFMNLAQSTIATQKMRIIKKLQVKNMFDVFHLAKQYGILNEN